MCFQQVINYSLLIFEQQMIKRLQKQSYYEVEQVVDKKIDEKGATLYFVKWKNWSASHNTWEPIRNLSTVKNLIQEFQDKSQGLKKVKRRYKQFRFALKRKRNKTSSKRQYTRIPRISQVKPEQRQAGSEPSKRKPGRPPKIRKQEGQFQKAIIVNGTKREFRVSESGIVEFKPSRTVEPASRQANQGAKVQKRTPKRKLISKISAIQRKRVKAIEQGLQNMHIVSSELNKQGLHQDQEQQQSSELGLQQVLLQCQNYKSVKIFFRQNKFHYQIPYCSNGLMETLTTTAEQIIKVNPKWLQEYYQGFYL